MNAQANILERGLEQAALAVLGASALGNLHLEPSHIGRGLAQRISGRLRQVESLVRRILFLMALRLAYVPVPKSDAAPRPAAAPALPDGVELAEFPRVTVRRLSLLPPKRAFGTDAQFPDTLQARLRPGQPGASGPADCCPAARVQGSGRACETPGAAPLPAEIGGGAAAHDRPGGQRLSPLARAWRAGDAVALTDPCRAGWLGQLALIFV